MVILSCLDRSPRGIHGLICKALLSSSFPVVGFLCKGDLHSWNSLKALLTRPLQLIMLMGREGLVASQGTPHPSRVGVAVLISEFNGRLWQWMGTHLAFTRPLIVEELNSGPRACLLNRAPSQGFLVKFPLLPVCHAHPTISGFPEHHLV